MYTDRLSRKKTGRIAGTIMAAAPASSLDPNSVVICHNCGKDGHYKSGYAVPGEVHGKGKEPAGQNKKAGGGAGQKTWCSLHKTTVHSDAESDVQGALSPQTRTGSFKPVVRNKAGGGAGQK